MLCMFLYQKSLSVEDLLAIIITSHYTAHETIRTTVVKFVAKDWLVLAQGLFHYIDQ